MRVLVLFCFYLTQAQASSDDLIFPKYFQFGVSTSAFQTEGAWNVDGKSPSMMDYSYQNFKEKVADGSNANDACKSYYKIDEDVENLKKLNVSFYRFSISWTRILPTGFNTTVNPEGIAYYNKLIDKLLENNINPMVTIFHWDLPQTLQDLGGFFNPKIVDIFEGYARVCFENFGDRVKFWTTINEAHIYCTASCAEGSIAPFIKSDYYGRYLCGHYLLLSHAKAYNVYKNEFQITQKGVVGMSAFSSWFEPASDSQEDKDAAERSMQFELGWFMHPILKTGDYPEVMRRRIDENSKKEGFGFSRLPTFSELEKKLLRNSWDYFGLNHYITYSVSNGDNSSLPIPSHKNDVGALETQPSSWKALASDNFRFAPWALRKLLNWIKNEYNNPSVIITENGYAGFQNEPLDDVDRQEYIKAYLNETLKAIVLDKCDVIGYTFWSFLDNFEWSSGYTLKFGLYKVDFDADDRTRTPRKSASLYKDIITSRRIPKK